MFKFLNNGLIFVQLGFKFKKKILKKFFLQSTSFKSLHDGFTRLQFRFRFFLKKIYKLRVFKSLNDRFTRVQFNFYFYQKIKLKLKKKSTGGQKGHCPPPATRIHVAVSDMYPCRWWGAISLLAPIWPSVDFFFFF